MLEYLFKPKLKERNNNIITTNTTNYNTALRVRISQETLRKYKALHKNISERIRTLIETDMNGSSLPEISREDTAGLKKWIDDSPALQVIGSIGVGKSTLVKTLIGSDREHTYLVMDAHNEYGSLPKTETISASLKESSRVILNENVVSAKALFPLYASQVLSQRFPDNFILVVEEAHRYQEIKGLLAESRKFCKVIAVSQEKLADFCPAVRVTL